MKPRWSVTALCAFFVAVALVVAGCGSSSSTSSSVPGGAVADVAGNPISTQAYKHWFFLDAKSQTPIIPTDPPNFTKCISDAKASIPSLKTATDAKLKSDCQMLFTTLNQQTLDFLIKAYWYQAQAHKLGIKITPAQVSAELAKEKKQQFKTPKAFQQFLKQSGYTQADINYRIMFSLIQKALLKKQPTTVTKSDISAYYNSHKSTFGTPAQRDMRIVLAKNSSQAQAALSALKGGQSWDVVAKKYSTDPTTKNKGGLLKNVSAGQQDAALSKAAFAAPKGKLMGPLKGQFGVYVFEVTKITPATQQSLQQASKQIKTTLTGQKQQTAQTAIDTQVKNSFGARTLCRPQYAMADCKGYKPPATASATAPGATTPAPSSGASVTATATSPSTPPATSSSSSSSSSTTSSK